MSHASGIKVSEGLATAFSSAQSNQTRCIKVGITNESLQEQESFPVEGSFEDDFALVTKCLEVKKPSYVLYRLDSTTASSTHEWLLLSYVPDEAAVREKMLYASTRASLLQSLGENRFVDSIFGTTMDEFTLQGYKKHLKSQNAPAPLTQREQELADIRKAEMSTSQPGGINARRSLLDSGITPSSDMQKFAKLLSHDAMVKIKQLSQEHSQSADFNTVILYLDTQTEVVEIKETFETTADDLSSHIPKDQPSFVYFAYPHSHKGEDQHSIIFVYCCPSKSNVRERMMYSTVKRAIVKKSEHECGITLAKILETDDPMEISQKYILDELHPKVETEAPVRARPRGPGRR